MRIQRLSLLTLLLCILAVPAASAQTFANSEPFGGEGENAEDEIETDRDSFTPATTMPGDERWIVESAYSFIDNRDVLEMHM